MTSILIAIGIAWFVASVLLLIGICANGSRISRIEDWMRMKFEMSRRMGYKD